MRVHATCSDAGDTLRRRIERLNEADTELACGEAKAALVRLYGARHEGALLGLPCDSELMRDLGYIREVYRVRDASLSPARRVMLRRRIVAIMDRHEGDMQIVSLLEDILGTHGCLVGGGA
jgi:hypothetical protein